MLYKVLLWETKWFFCKKSCLFVRLYDIIYMCERRGGRMKKILVIMLIVVCSLSGISYAKVGSEETTLNYMGITLNIDNVNKLSDIAPFVLNYMNLNLPDEMK